MLAALLALSLQSPSTTCEPAWRAALGLEGRSRTDSTQVADSLAAQPGECDRAVAAYLRAFSPLAGSQHWRERLAVERDLNEAIRRWGTEPRLMLALGHLRYQQGIRVDGRRLIERALDQFADASPAATPRERAVAAYLLGLMLQNEWRDWRSFGHLRGLSVGRWNCAAFSSELDALTGKDGSDARVERPGPVDINIECPALFESIMDSDFLFDTDLKRNSRRGLERRFREAIERDPTYWPPYQALGSELVYEGRWPDVERLAHGAARAFPDDYRPRALIGLVAYREGNSDRAVALFDSALTAMPGEVAMLYREPVLVLNLAEQRTFASQPDEMRGGLATAYWRSRRATFLTEGNDRLLEHHARLTEADAIFAIDSREIAGWNTAPGSAWVRYGRPLKIRDLAVDNGRASFWTYGPDPDLVFTRLLTYAEFRVHEYFAGQMQLMHERLPARFRPPDVDSVVPVEHQIARFRGDSGDVDLVVVAGGSDAFRGRSARTETGVTLLDAEFREVARWRSRTLPRQGVAVTLQGLRPGRSYNLAVEMHDRERRVLGQARDTLTAALAVGRPAISDLLLVRQVDARGAATRSRADLDIEHLGGRAVPEGGAVGLVWEVYDVAADSAGTWNYRVRIEVKDAGGRSLISRLLRGGRSDNPSAILEFDRTMVPVGDRAVEWVNLASDWKSGRYQLVLRIEDVVGGGIATATTHVTVAQPEAKRSQ